MTKEKDELSEWLFNYLAARYTPDEGIAALLNDHAAAGLLKEFVEHEGWEGARALCDMLRGCKLESLAIIADMLDPAKPGVLKLKLTRKRGKPHNKHPGRYELIAFDYLRLRDDFEARGQRSPDKAAKREVIEKRGVSEKDIRAALAWWYKKWKKPEKWKKPAR
jgi:hypothetical protein